MYTPASFREDRLPVMHDFMRAHPLAAVVSSGPQGLSASHVPLLLDTSQSPDGVLRGHLARQNPQWRQFGDSELLVIFSGPDHYITPAWYPSKEATGRVVPTWNYIAVHAYGTARLIEEPAELKQLVADLTVEHEKQFPMPWKIEDAPEEYVNGLLRAIVGFEIKISRLEGKWKLSQNRSAQDRAGVAEGLRETQTSEAQILSDLIDLA